MLLSANWTLTWAGSSVSKLLRREAMAGHQRGDFLPPYRPGLGWPLLTRARTPTTSTTTMVSCLKRISFVGVLKRRIFKISTLYYTLICCFKFWTQQPAATWSTWFVWVSLSSRTPSFRLHRRAISNVRKSGLIGQLPQQ